MTNCSSTSCPGIGLFAEYHKNYIAVTYESFQVVHLKRFWNWTHVCHKRLFVSLEKTFYWDYTIFMRHGIIYADLCPRKVSVCKLWEDVYQDIWNMCRCSSSKLGWFVECSCVRMLFNRVGSSSLHSGIWVQRTTKNWHEDIPTR